MPNNTKKKNKGFTLLETLVAIGLFSALIIAPLSIASNGLSAANAGKDRITAVALAQDAIEYIRNVRDANRLNGASNWLMGLTGSQECRYNVTGNGHKGCRVDSLASLTERIKPNTGIPLLYDSSTGLYGYTTGQDSLFTRFAIVDEIVTNREARVTVVVSWRSKFVTKTVKVAELITNW